MKYSCQKQSRQFLSDPDNRKDLRLPVNRRYGMRLPGFPVNFRTRKGLQNGYPVNPEKPVSGFLSPACCIWGTVCPPFPALPPGAPSGAEPEVPAGSRPPCKPRYAASISSRTGDSDTFISQPMKNTAADNARTAKRQRFPAKAGRENTFFIIRWYTRFRLV